MFVSRGRSTAAHDAETWAGSSRLNRWNSISICYGGNCTARVGTVLNQDVCFLKFVGSSATHCDNAQILANGAEESRKYHDHNAKYPPDPHSYDPTKNTLRPPLAIPYPLQRGLTLHRTRAIVRSPPSCELRPAASHSP